MKQSGHFGSPGRVFDESTVENFSLLGTEVGDSRYEDPEGMGDSVGLRAGQVCVSVSCAGLLGSNRGIIITFCYQGIIKETLRDFEPC